MQDVKSPLGIVNVLTTFYKLLHLPEYFIPPSLLHADSFTSACDKFEAFMKIWVTITDQKFLMFDSQEETNDYYTSFVLIDTGHYMTLYYLPQNLHLLKKDAAMYACTAAHMFDSLYSSC